MQRICSGHIVNVVSVAPGRRAIEGFSAALAEEMMAFGIRVITADGGSVNGQQPSDSASAAAAIIAAVDAEVPEPDVLGKEVTS
jgi:NAD(P)-dependent dehydrogenase (short-subunit alcohol dehydrogenase family)